MYHMDAMHFNTNIFTNTEIRALPWHFMHEIKTLLRLMAQRVNRMNFETLRGIFNNRHRLPMLNKNV